MLYPGTQPQAHLLFSTLALSFIYIIILEIAERKEVKRVSESRKYAESAAAAGAVVRKSFLRFLPVRAETEVYHTPKSLQQPKPPAFPFSSFHGVCTCLCKNYPSENRLTTKLGSSSPLRSLSEERVMPCSCLHRLPWKRTSQKRKASQIPTASSQNSPEEMGWEDEEAGCQEPNSAQS